ncbi:MAG: hypothetical protein UY62_C0092G0003 [Parcubacteria group bacterium GW2011_GWF2_50_9]|nr:MAG: hypothetical protein UY62_C0092G0003 [Parcubacteria group bacterium GW2011_GWF2_50_9]
MVIESAWVAVCGVGVVESLTCTVKSKVPKALGVPEIKPVELFNDNPVGRFPVLILHVYGSIPPVAETLDP